ncbi:Hypothetical protein NTJ_07067 [Nesidiocoris tenuis]|uniref:Uncharacterized protein n=1 Tax=Nesidiocoris tenuis TaxID=355587 RepID=A0ABN7APW8_9HEMI|nr:Hypothetical protein NTJ_07067 [Nesidiocoris tenuis]
MVSPTWRIFAEEICTEGTIGYGVFGGPGIRAVYPRRPGGKTNKARGPGTARRRQSFGLLRLLSALLVRPREVSSPEQQFPPAPHSISIAFRPIFLPPGLYFPGADEEKIGKPSLAQKHFSFIAAPN